MSNAVRRSYPAERARLAPHFTDLDGPVFALVNLPETVKGALFARYSRYPGHAAAAVPGRVRRTRCRARRRAADGDARARARRSSTSASSSATATTRWPSSAARTSPASGSRTSSPRSSSARGSAPTSSSRTRYIAYDAPMPGGGYRYYRDAGARPGVRGGDGRAVRRLRRARCRACARGSTRRSRARDGEPEAARRRAVKAKALDLLRGLLPAASLSHMGIYATGQAYEQLILHLLAPPAARGARATASMILDAIKAVMPSFVARVERPGPRRRVGRLPASAARRERALGRAARARPRRATPRTRPSVRLLHVDGDEDRLLAALLFEAAGVARGAHAGRGRARCRRGARALLADLVGERAQPPPPPRPRLRGAALPLRDRLRLRRLPRPPAPPHAHRAVAGAHARPRRRGARRRSPPPAAASSTRARSSARARSTSGSSPPACATRRPYALCLGYRIRYVLDLNAREAMHLIELRSGREGHPSYRAVAHEMHAQIADRHPAVAAAMKHVDHALRAAPRAHPRRDARRRPPRR